MTIRIAALPAMLLAVAAGGASAQERGYCTARPGLGTTPCTIDTGRVSIETGVVDWQRDVSAAGRSDDLAIAATSLRVGVTHRLEIIAAWAPYGRTRFRDAATRRVETADGVGDATLGFKHSLARPDGSGLSIAVLPFVSLPVGREPIGAGRWEPGVALPISYALTPSVSLQATPQVNAAPDVDLNGRHPLYTLVGGVGVAVGGGVSATGELMVQRNDDPGAHETHGFGSVALAWGVTGDFQLDTGAVFGLDAASPDLRLYAGISRRF